MRKATKVCLFLISHGKKECRPGQNNELPSLRKNDMRLPHARPWLSRQGRGRQLSRLSGCKAGSPSTTKAGLSAGTGDKPLDTSVKVKERDDDWDQTPEEICQQIIGLVPWADGETVLEPFRGDGNFSTTSRVACPRTGARSGRGGTSFDTQARSPTPSSPTRRFGTGRAATTWSFPASNAASGWHGSA